MKGYSIKVREDRPSVEMESLVKNHWCQIVEASGGLPQTLRVIGPKQGIIHFVTELVGGNETVASHILANAKKITNNW